MNEIKRNWRAAIEQRCVRACDQWEKRNVRFFDQIIDQPIIPEQAAYDHQDVPARLLFGRGNFPAGIRPFDDARIIPESQLPAGEMIRNNDFLDGCHELCDLTSE